MDAPDAVPLDVTGALPFGLSLAVAGGVFVPLFARAMLRSLNHDEHQFVAPIALLLQDHLFPSVDYAYFHMPNQAYLFAVLSWWTPNKLLVARLAAALCGTAIIVLLFRTGWRLLADLEPVDRWLAVATPLIAVVCGRLFTYTSGLAWNHETSTLCALVAFLVHVRGLDRPRAAAVLASGLMLGVAIGIRLTVAPAVVPFLLTLWFGGPPAVGRRLADIGRWLAGAFLGLLPAGVAFAMAPRQMLFDNIGYARISAAFFAMHGSDEPMTLGGKLAYFGERFTRDPGDAALLAVFAFFAVVVGWRAHAYCGPRRTALSLAVGMVAAMLVGAVLPTPSRWQYVFALLPFMVLTIYLVAASAPRTMWLPRRARAIALALIGLVMVEMPGRYDGLLDLPHVSRWTPIQQAEIGSRIAAATSPTARVLTMMPITPIEAGLRVYPEFATGSFAWRVGPVLSPTDRARYRVLSAAELEQLWARRPPDAVLVAPRDGLSAPIAEMARARNYRPVDLGSSGLMLWLPSTRTASAP